MKRHTAEQNDSREATTSMADRLQLTLRKRDELFERIGVWHQLIVVGNGFDLECELKSRFIDFFAPKFACIDKLTDFRQAAWCAQVDEADLNVWDFILYKDRDTSWCDVEGVIKDWVFPPRLGHVTSARVYGAWRRTRKCPFVEGGRAMDTNGRLMGEREAVDFTRSNVARFAWYKFGAEGARALGEEGLLRFLANELTRLEQRFDAYMCHEVLGNSAYLERSAELFRAICNDGLPGEDGWNVQTSVLSFNYSDPFTSAFIGVPTEDVVNIHGRLGGGIIFGIDGKDCMDDPTALPFTKTYRVAVANTRIHHELFYVHTDQTFGSSTEVIKFYGHSLGEADYSYFQSIFDGVNLYGGGTKLVFYYRPWHEGDSEVSEGEARTKTVKRVAQLLNTYGRTMDNHEHGKNLMHKLLLEGRLVVKHV
ncbi:MAG: AbiH family protein [Coriobacteriales bacterium]|nr:AbiH family protein [Coriobacteriales bacterium]